MKKSTIENLIWLAIAACFIRGLFVWDMGGSAVDSFPIASAICFAGSIIASVIMYNNKN